MPEEGAPACPTGRSPGIDDDLVSVLMPVLNTEHDQFRDAVKSILDQDHANLELVIVEDPSPRTGQGVVEGIGDPRIRYHLNGERTSLREQLNLGVSLCRGEYIARMDSDDISCPSRIGKQLRYLSAHPEVSLVGTNLDYMSEGGVKIGTRRYPQRHEDIVRDLRLYSSIAHATIMIRKADMLKMGGYEDSAPMEDWDLWCRMAVAGMRFHNIQEPLYSYRQHTGMGKFRTLRNTLKTGIELKERYFKHGKGTWGLRESLRCWAERVMMYMPARLVFGLFLIYSTMFENRGRPDRKADKTA